MSATLNPEWAGAELARWLNGGVLLSLHFGSPGRNGAARLIEPFRTPPSAFRIIGNRAVNAVRIDLTRATRSGRATYVGVWHRTGQWWFGGRLIPELSIREGELVGFPRGELVIRIEG